jgi:hypothetical protein
MGPRAAALSLAISYAHIVAGLEATAQHEVAWDIAYWLRKVLQFLVYLATNALAGHPLAGYLEASIAEAYRRGFDPAYITQYLDTPLRGTCF